MPESRIDALRRQLRVLANPTDAAIQQRYHKTQLLFYGIKTNQRRELLHAIFGRRPRRAEVEPEIHELWQSKYWDERILAIELINAITSELALQDLPWLHQLTRVCDGWALLDTLATDALGSLALAYGNKAYEPIRAWSGDEWMWTRRASILVHLLPARKRELQPDYAWPTWEERLHETDFFIRKAIGWALRESCKHYPQEVCDFLLRVGQRASGLTRREGARNLPAELRVKVLGK